MEKDKKEETRQKASKFELKKKKYSHILKTPLEVVFLFLSLFHNLFFASRIDNMLNK